MCSRGHVVADSNQRVYAARLEILIVERNTSDPQETPLTLVAGHVDSACTLAPAIVPHIPGGRVRAPDGRASAEMLQAVGSIFAPSEICMHRAIPFVSADSARPCGRAFDQHRAMRPSGSNDHVRGFAGTSRLALAFSDRCLSQHSIVLAQGDGVPLGQRDRRTEQNERSIVSLTVSREKHRWSSCRLEGRFCRNEWSARSKR